MLDGVLNAAGGQLDLIVDDTLTGTGTIEIQKGGSLIATLNVSLQGEPVTFYAKPYGHGASTLTTSDETRIWTGGSGNWTDAAF